jgi:glycerol kinase
MLLKVKTMQYILAMDQGTSSSRCIVYDQQTNAIAMAQQPFEQYYPYPGWVEHNAEEIWSSQLSAFQHVMQQSQLTAADIAGIGITNQRETTVVWERSTGKPIYNAIVWQDRRTAETCTRLKQAGFEAMVKAKTGLLLDAYFSATKICWILDHIKGARLQAKHGELAFGTIDTWLVWNLTQGELHITDVSNAARTLLYNIDTMKWDDELLTLFDIPASMLPTVKTSSEIYGLTHNPGIDAGIPIAAIVGDQQAGLFGQLCINEGMVKCTYGTGAFLMINTGSHRVASTQRLLTTIAWQIGTEIQYALEGSVFTGGAVIQWLRDGLQLFPRASDSEELANSVEDNGGVYFVPALTGLGTPHWDPHARGSIFGISRGTTLAHLTRAALESIGFQVEDILQVLATETNKPITQLKIDGGAAVNNVLAQFQADISALEVIRPTHLETTALGAAYLAGIATGFWTLDELSEKWRIDQSFHGTLTSEEIDSRKHYWLKAVERAKNWKD